MMFKLSRLVVAGAWLSSVAVLAAQSPAKNVPKAPAKATASTAFPRASDGKPDLSGVWQAWAGHENDSLPRKSLSTEPSARRNSRSATP